MIRLLILLSITVSSIEAVRYNRSPSYAHRNPWNYLRRSYIPRPNYGRYQHKSDPCCDFYCANGGNCTTDGLAATCQCLGEWTGDRCDVSPCDGYEGCDPGLQCVVDTDSGMKKCCPDEANPCDSVTCENGGECLINYESQTGKCCCAKGFTGDNCEIEIDACTTNPCENDGTCQVGADDQAVCTCGPTFVGPTCAIDCTQEVVCPSGTTTISVSGRNRCYWISDTTAQSWIQAQAICGGKGMTLWEPNTEAEKTAVAQNLPYNDFWVGVTDLIYEGVLSLAATGQLFNLGITGTNTQATDCVQISVHPDSINFEVLECTTESKRYICERLTPCDSFK